MCADLKAAIKKLDKLFRRVRVSCVEDVRSWAGQATCRP
jgi:hypothetical protein